MKTFASKSFLLKRFGMEKAQSVSHILPDRKGAQGWARFQLRRCLRVFFSFTLWLVHCFRAFDFYIRFYPAVFSQDSEWLLPGRASLLLSRRAGQTRSKVAKKGVWASIERLRENALGLTRLVSARSHGSTPACNSWSSDWAVCAHFCQHVQDDSAKQASFMMTSLSWAT